MDSSGGVQFGNFGIDNCDRVLSIITHGLSDPLAAVPAAISCQNPLTTSVTYVTHRADVTAPAHSLGNEIDKLPSNISLGRDAAGVHYCSDSARGLFVGEQQALWLLRDYSRIYNERFDSFIVRRFNGGRVKIMNGELEAL